MPEVGEHNVWDVQKIMTCVKWDIESIITHEFPLDRLEEAIRTANNVNSEGNVVIGMKKNNAPLLP